MHLPYDFEAVLFSSDTFAVFPAIFECNQHLCTWVTLFADGIDYLKDPLGISYNCCSL